MLKSGRSTSEYAQVRDNSRRSWFGAVIGGLTALISTAATFIATTGPDLVPAVTNINPEWGIALGALVTMASLMRGSRTVENYDNNRIKLKDKELDIVRASQLRE